jgi:hypothetical protein
MYSTFHTTLDVTQEIDYEQCIIISSRRTENGENLFPGRFGLGEDRYERIYVEEFRFLCGKFALRTWSCVGSRNNILRLTTVRCASTASPNASNRSCNAIF